MYIIWGKNFVCTAFKEKVFLCTALKEKILCTAFKEKVFCAAFKRKVFCVQHLMKKFLKIFFSILSLCTCCTEKFVKKRVVNVLHWEHVSCARRFGISQFQNCIKFGKEISKCGGSHFSWQFMIWQTPTVDRVATDVGNHLVYCTNQ